MTKQKELFKSYWREFLVLSLVFANLLAFAALFDARLGPLKVYFLDVGQGDAIFVETPSHKRLLLDGGPNKSVMTELGRILPFGAKRIDLMIESHPDKDHIGGLPEVAERYEIGMFLEPGVPSDSSIDETLHERLQLNGVPTLLARRGMVVNFGDGVTLTILFPNQDVSRWDTNDASIVARLEYGESSFLLTGDSPAKVENILLSLDKKYLEADVLKVGHHGSRTSTSLLFAQTVLPQYAIISAGENNAYGHPHGETLHILKMVEANILNTFETGTIEFESDGVTLQRN